MNTGVKLPLIPSSKERDFVESPSMSCTFYSQFKLKKLIDK